MKTQIGVCAGIAVALGAMATTALAHENPAAAEIERATLMTKDLPEFPGKEAVMLTVEYPPGGSSPSHRHNAHVFVYVLEGRYATQVAGGERLVLEPGQTFYENPSDEHVVSENASQTEPAKILVVMFKDKDPAQ